MISNCYDGKSFKPNWKVLIYTVHDLITVYQLWNANLNNRYMNVCVRVLAAKWFFRTCGATGPTGPTPSQCSSSYRKSTVNVTVGTTGTLKGIQMWRVPETGLYRYVSQGKITTSPYGHTNQWFCIDFFCLLRLDMHIFTLGFDFAVSAILVSQDNSLWCSRWTQCSQHVQISWSLYCWRF